MRYLHRLFHTIIHLRHEQIIFRIISYLKFVRGRIVPKYSLAQSQSVSIIDLERLPVFINVYESFSQPSTFCFLNIKHSFSDDIDWNYSEFGKLWTYNLNYFEFLLQAGIRKETGLKLIKSYVGSWEKNFVGFEPYPMSLRIINWVKFCMRHKIVDIEISRSIFYQTKHLSRNLEFHLMANHLLENAFAICIGASHCGVPALFNKGKALLNRELNEQVLADGAHYELSPMYHQIVLGRLLDLIQILQIRNIEVAWTEHLKSIASKMTGWLKQVSFSEKDLPLFNDCALGIAPTTTQLLHLATILSVSPTIVKLGESGYRKFKVGSAEMLLDIGNINPSYQPGHSHADTFSFELYLNGSPVIVDTGTSTYITGPRRTIERSTTSHNTVSVNGQNSSDVWASHRVGRRAKVRVLRDEESFVEAEHDGFNKYKLICSRTVKLSESGFVIFDTLRGGGISLNKKITAVSKLHFHPDRAVKVDGNTIIVDQNVRIVIEGNSAIHKSHYEYAPEFNVLIPATVIDLYFHKAMVMTITIKDETC
jgi:uncharacterized heparinase superfamily protein